MNASTFFFIIFSAGFGATVLVPLLGMLSTFLWETFIGEPARKAEWAAKFKRDDAWRRANFPQDFA